MQMRASRLRSVRGESCSRSREDARVTLANCILDDLALARLSTTMVIGGSREKLVLQSRCNLRFLPKSNFLYRDAFKNSNARTLLISIERERERKRAAPDEDDGENSRQKIWKDESTRGTQGNLSKALSEPSETISVSLAPNHATIFSDPQR